MSSVVIEKHKKHHKLTKDEMRVLVAIAEFIQAIGGVRGLSRTFHVNHKTIYDHMEGKQNV